MKKIIITAWVVMIMMTWKKTKDSQWSGCWQDSFMFSNFNALAPLWLRVLN